MRLLSTISFCCICLFLSEKSFSQPGSLDKTFGTNGIVITDFNHDNDKGQKLAIQKDGKILLAGFSVDSLNRANIFVCRYLSSGVLDNSFGKNGKCLLSNVSVVISAIALQKSQKIVLGGYIGNRLFLCRLNTNGTLDSSFGLNGIVRYDSLSYYILFNIKIQNDDKIITVGMGDGSKYDVSNVFRLYRFNANGSIDTAFGDKGNVSSHFGDGNDAANDLVIQKNGKIVVGGFTNFYGDHSPPVTVARYNVDGSLDSSFGINGIDTTFIHSPYDIGVTLALQNDQKIIASAFSSNGVNDSYGHIRYKENGMLDSSFGANGIVITKVSTSNNSSYYYDVPNSVYVDDNDGKIYQAGTATNGTNIDFGLLKYNPNGTLDSSFGNDGKVITSILNGDDYGESVLLQDSKIIVGGYAKNTSDNDFTLVRYNNENTLPVTLLNFSAQKQNNTALLQWQTSNEINNSYFDIERSPNSKIFSSIGTKQALHNDGVNNYSFTDNTPLKGINYYRLKQVDKDGKFSYSGIASVEFLNDGAVFAIIPNPANNFIKVVLPSSNTVSEIIIYDVNGKKILHEQIAANITSKQININQLTAGVYNVVLMQNGKHEMIKLVKK